MASAVSAVIDIRLVSVLARMAWHLLEDAAGQAPHKRRVENSHQWLGAPEQRHDQAQ